MKMIENEATVNFLMKVKETMTEAQKEAFSAGLRKLWWTKQTSDEGEYKSFSITMDDVSRMALKVTKAK